MKNLLEIVRKACPPGLWSQGVKLVREQAVSVEGGNDSEITVRVAASGHAVAPTVVLYPKDAEWACDCLGKVDPCAHVAAAVIALNQTPDVGQLPVAAKVVPPKLGYRFARESGRLVLRVVLVQPDGREEILQASLTTLMAQQGRGLAFHPSHADLKVDRILAATPRRRFPSERSGIIFEELSAGADVKLDGRSVVPSGEPVVPLAAVKDQKRGVVLVVSRDPAITELLDDGIALCGDIMRPLGETQLSGEKLEKLPLERFFAREQFGELVTSILPEMRKRIPVTVQTKRLPSTARHVRPRLVMDLSQKEHTLSVLPTLVYGNPVQARIDAGQLVHVAGDVPVRDESAEKQLVFRLRDELNLVLGRRVDFDGKDAVAFAARIRNWKSEVDEETHDELFSSVPLVPKMTIEGDAFDLVFESPEGENEDGERRSADAAAVLRSWKDGLDVVPLDGGGWAPLPQDWLAKYGDRVADLLAARADDKRVSTFALPALAELCDDLDQPRPPRFERLAPLLGDFETIPEAVLPEDLNATLRSYQRQGVNWLCFVREVGLGAVLADDMGLGKTLQTLCAIRGRTLVVCPRSVVHNWAAEIKRFRPKARFSIYHGTERELDEDADITLTTYAVLRIDLEHLKAQAWDTLVLDEAQAIKNSDSQVARAAYQIDATFRIALSGTPVENRLEELWSQLHFTNRGLLGGRSDFVERYAKPIALGRKDVAAKLRSRIRPFLLRRMKQDVAPELPPKTNAVLYCELDEAERVVYDAVRAATRAEVVAKLKSGGNVILALEALLRLRQAACHSQLIPGQTAETSSKIVRLIDALEQAAAEGHKALVFSQWTSLLDLVEPHLRAAGIAFNRLDGSTRDRATVVNEFQDAAGPPVMLVSLKAGGTGLNLTAADHVFLLDPWWNPAVEDQAADRAHRIGQERPVMVYRLVTKDTVEEGILALQERKRGLADAALGEADQAAALTREDLMALLA